MMPPTISRRERLRAATEAEIKDLARRQVAEVGPASLSLREIARQMGMTSSALYRYYPSRDALLEELVADSFASLADALEAAEAGCRSRSAPSAETWVEVARAHRRWALEHPSEYALVFNTPLIPPGGPADGQSAPPGRKLEQMKRGIDVLFRAMQLGFEAGEFDPARAERDVSPALAARIDRWRRRDPSCPVPPSDLPATAVAACMVAWAQLHGAITLELSGRLPPELRPAEELFDFQMKHLLSASLGWVGAGNH